MKKPDPSWLALVLLSVAYGIFCFLMVILIVPAHAVEVTEDFQESSVTETYVEPEQDSSSEIESPEIVVQDDETSIEVQTEINTEQVFEPIQTPEYESDSVLVYAADLEYLYSLISDLSRQLALYADSVPAGYTPSEEDVVYRDSLLETLQSLSVSLEILSDPYDAERLSLREQQEQTDRETLESIRDSLLLLTAPLSEDNQQDTEQEETSEKPLMRGGSDSEESPGDEPSEVEPEYESDVSAPDEPTEEPSDPDSVEESPDEVQEDNSISEQDFYRLVLALLLCILLVPILKWVMSFIKSFFPV